MQPPSRSFHTSFCLDEPRIRQHCLCVFTEHTNQASPQGIGPLPPWDPLALLLEQANQEERLPTPVAQSEPEEIQAASGDQQKGLCLQTLIGTVRRAVDTACLEPSFGFYLATRTSRYGPSV